MRSSVDAAAFYKAMTALMDIPAKSPVKVLQEIKVEFTADHSTLSATNFNTWLSVTIPASGGIMGLAQLLRTLLLHITGWTPHFDIAGIINYAINLPILCIAWKRLDHRVVFKTLLSVTSTTVFLSLIPRTGILHGDQLAECLIGGILCGCGIGITLWMGGTTGGMDVIGMMLIKKGSHTSIGHVNLFWNMALYAICAAAFNLSTAIYSILFSFISTTAMDKLHMQNINVEVTVVTNMIDILVVLARNPKIRVVFAGGKINKSRDGFWGGMTLDFISRLKSDIAFVGAVGVDVKENSVSTYDIDDGINKAAIIRHSKKAYVVAEARKLSTDGNYNYTTLDTLSGLITDSEPAADIRAAADSYGVEIILP